MIPDHIHPNRAAPETYDRDWFLAQLNGRDPTAPRDTVAPAVLPAAVVTVPVEPPVEPLAVDPFPVVDVDAAAGTLAPTQTGSPARYAGVLVGAGLGVLLVASAAFAIGGTPTPLADPPAQAQPDGAPTAGRTGTPNPQLTTFALPDEDAPQGDTVRGRADSPRSDPPQTGATTAPGDNSSPTHSPSATPTPEPTEDPTPTPEPTEDPDPTADPTPDPDPTPDSTPDPSELCELVPAVC